MINKFSVGSVGKKIEINNLAPRPSLTAAEAFELAAYLVATAAPIMPGSATEVLGKFLKLVATIAEDTDLGRVAAAELEE